jgi:hypothetical protein
LKEIHRVLKLGGLIGICCPDWRGFILSPPLPELTSTMAAYTTPQIRNGGDVQTGRKLGVHLATAGLDAVKMSARYECYPSVGFIGEYLAVQLKQEGDGQSAEAFRRWSQAAGGMFTQAWISAIGRKNG